MGLAEFIRANIPAITAEWEAFARSLKPASGLSRLRLKDHIGEILAFVARDIEAPQTPAEQFDKSRGLTEDASAPDTAAEVHGELRHDDGYDIMEMVSEYRALRASIIKLWTRTNKTLSDDDILALTRFNEAIDQALAESVVKFSQKVEESKDLLLGILGHDIRSPLATIAMSASVLKLIGAPNERQSILLAQIETSSQRVRDIVADLLDLAKAKLGAGLPLKCADMSLSDLCEDIVAEMRVQNPARRFDVTLDGDIHGHWDKIRLGQVVSNLMGNAVQYSPPGSPVAVTLTQETGGVVLSVHNTGTPIPRAYLERIFQSFTRAPGTAPGPGGETQNLGLGLFISREIVNAHGGTVSAISGKMEGTTFSVRLPYTPGSGALS